MKRGVSFNAFLCYDFNKFVVTIQKAVFREVFFVNIVHRKPENCGAKSCKA